MGAGVSAEYEAARSLLEAVEYDDILLVGPGGVVVADVKAWPRASSSRASSGYLEPRHARS